MAVLRAAMDTNVLFAALYSNRGGSRMVLDALADKRWTLVLSNTVLTEYEEVIVRERAALQITEAEINDTLDTLCGLAEKWQVSGSSAIQLPDVDDEALARLALTSVADCIVTHNRRHFVPLEPSGVKILAPREFLNMLRLHR